jgi:hypothetical protein
LNRRRQGRNELRLFLFWKNVLCADGAFAVRLFSTQNRIPASAQHSVLQAFDIDIPRRDGL